MNRKSGSWSELVVSPGRAGGRRNVARLIRRLQKFGLVVSAVAIVAVALIATGTPAQADTFTFTSCHVTGGCTGTSFGTVTLTQVGTSVNVDVVLSSGELFVETGAGGNSLFLFNDAISGSTITNITATLNGTTVTIAGGLSGATGQPPIMADGTGTFTARVFCTTASSCNGASGADINDLHFTVTNATLAQLETANAAGNIFVADVLFTGTGFTGPVDVTPGTTNVPEATTLAFLGTGLVAMGLIARRRGFQA
jgi:hypothetical protein